MELSGIAAGARRWWWTLIAATIWAALVSYAVTSRVPPSYESEVRLLVGPLSGDLNMLRASGQLAGTYADLVTSQPVLTAASIELGGTDPAQLRLATSATADSLTRLLSIRVRDGNPQNAARIANTVGAKLVEYVARDLPSSPPAAPGTVIEPPEGGLRVVDAATPNPDPVAPQVSLIVVMSAAAGLVGALALVLLIDYFGQTIASEREIGELASVGFLGTVARWRGRRGEHRLVVEAAPDSRAAAAHRLVATRVALASQGEVNSVLVAGSDGGLGSGEVAANLAAALAADGRRVALVDANEQQAEVTMLLGLEDRPGLYDLLGRDWSVNGEGPEALLVRRGSGLIVLPAGRRDGVVQVELIPRLIDRLLAGPVEVVVTAGPPADDDPAAMVWARHTDATVLVARRNATRRDDFVQAADALRRVGGNLIGAVLLDYRGGRGGMLARRGRPSQDSPATFSTPMRV